MSEGAVKAHLQRAEGFAPGAITMTAGAAVWTPKEAGASVAFAVVDVSAGTFFSRAHPG